MQREQRSSARGCLQALALGGALALALTGSSTAFAASTNPIAAAEWALSTLNVTKVRGEFNAYGAGVIVAVVDSGVDPNQPDLKGRLVDGINLVNPSSPTSDYSDQDSESHGTSIATVIAGHPHTVNGSDYGMIGLADKAEIMPVKVDNAGGHTSSQAIATGIAYAVSHGAQVINISLISSTPAPEVTSAVNAALAHGVVVVVATGNDAKTGNSTNTLADIPGVLDVAGVDSTGQKYSFGHYGSDVNVAAPANSIEVGLTGGKYGEVSGTSQAAPWVAGEAALLIAEHPTWTSGQIVATIINNTLQVANGQTKAGQRVDDNVGYGVIDPVAALGAAEPASTANPLGGPAITGSPGASASGGATGSSAAGAQPSATATTGTAAAGKSSSKMPLILGVGAGVVVLVALLIFLLTRGNRNGGGKGGPGGGGGGGNGYYAPQSSPGGQYSGQQYGGQPQYPQQGQQQQPANPYQQQPNPYQQGQPPQQYPQQGQQGGYGQGPQNPYSGR